MSRVLSCSAGALAFASTLAAQIAIAPQQFGTAPTYQYPVSYFANNNGTTTLNWRTTAARTQALYDAVGFTNQGITGPMTINRLKWRAANGVVNAGGSVYSLVTVQMSTSPLQHPAISTTFATNRGADNTIVYAGPVTTLPCNGGAPNDYVIDIVLTTPFVYDPSTGNDLCIEFDHPAPVPTTGVPTMASCATSSPTGYIDGASAMRAATQTATTGTSSFFAPLVWIEFTGPGGVSSVDIGSNQPYGAGCYLQADSWYENFPVNGLGHTFDLRGTASSVNSIRATAIAGNTNYTVSPGSNAWYTPTGTPLLANAVTPTTVMGDDSLSVVLNLPFTFTFPGGSTAAVHAAANGYIVLADLGTASTSSDFSPAITDMLGSTTGTHYDRPRLFPLWHDLHASRNTIGLGALTPGVYFDIDPSNTVAYVTWVDVGELNPSTANTSYNNFQVAIYANGDVEYRYGRCDLLTATASQNIITGFSKGRVGAVNSVDPGNRDLTAAMPFSTNGPDNLPLLMTTPALGFLNESRPLIGKTLNLQMANIPASAGFAVRIISYTAVVPGLDLGFQGMPGCFQHVGLALAATDFFVGGPTITTPFNIPNSPVYIGNNFFTQCATFVPGINPLGAISSNGLRHVIGVF